VCRGVDVIIINRKVHLKQQLHVHLTSFKIGIFWGREGWSKIEIELSLGMVVVLPIKNIPKQFAIYMVAQHQGGDG